MNKSAFRQRDIYLRGTSFPFSITYENEPSTTVLLYIVSRKEIEGTHLANILGWLFIKDEILERILDIEGF